MRAFLLVCCLLCWAFRGFAQQVPSEPGPPPNPPAAERPSEPGTHSAQITPASKAPKPVQQPDVRLDSQPHTDIDTSVDSSKFPSDYGLGANAEIDLGHDILPTTPPGMLARDVEDNPRIVYFFLPHRSGDTISPGDRDILAARRADLVRAAEFRGYDLHQSGWQYQQGICPALQPDAEQVVGVPAPGDGGSILLHFIRREHGRDSAFTGVVPRDPAQPVRVIAVAHRSVEDGPKLLLAKTGGPVVNQALPPADLFRNLQPVEGWIAASACIAEFAGAYPHIPNEPFLSEDIVTAPAPLIRIKLDGSRETVFTDRVDDTHYFLWDEQVSSRGRVQSARHDLTTVAPRPVTNPPVPGTHTITNLPEPPTHIQPEPPSPLAGTKQ